MKTLNKNNGFTLIETLVAINLSFIAISLVFSFYLFAQKFAETLSRNYLDKYTQMSFFNNLEEKLTNSDGYFISFVEDRIIINTSNEDSILFSPKSILLNGIFALTKLDSILIRISTDTESDLIQWNSGIINNTRSNGQTLESNKVRSILVEIKRNKKKYSYILYSNPSSVSIFQNIPNPNLLSSY